MSAAQEITQYGYFGGEAPADRARRIAPIIAASSNQIERDRALPKELLDALHGAALFRTLLPRAFRGEEVPLHDFVQMQIVIAAADASTAWCVGQASGCSMAAAYLKPEIAYEIWGADPRAVLAWGMGPQSRAVVVDGGYMVTGKWNFASGSRHCTWLGGHCKVVERDGSLRGDAEGNPIERTMLFKREVPKITDNWRVMGLRGTGSDTYEVKDLFVPDDYTVQRDLPTNRQTAGTLYHFTSTHAYAAGFAGVALGICRGTLDAFITLASDKTPAASTRPMRDSHVIQSLVARSEARWRSARSLLLETLRDCWRRAEAGLEMTNDERVSIRLASTFAIQTSREVVETIYQEAGSTAIFEDNPFERRFRDMHAVSQQVQGRSAHFEAVGQHLLGQTPHARFL
jgi:alkylation response protein AidB-like acyl-CoA dehydrogenase